MLPRHWLRSYPALGWGLTARKYWSQCRELSLGAITHNVIILWRVAQSFLQSAPALVAFSVVDLPDHVFRAVGDLDDLVPKQAYSDACARC